MLIFVLGISERYGAAPTPSMTSQRCSANVGRGLRQRSWQSSRQWVQARVALLGPPRARRSRLACPAVWSLGCGCRLGDVPAAGLGFEKKALPYGITNLPHGVDRSFTSRASGCQPRCQDFLVGLDPLACRLFSSCRIVRCICINKRIGLHLVDEFVAHGKLG